MTAVDEGRKEGSALPPGPESGPNAQPRARAREKGDSVALQVVTQSAWRVRLAVTRVAARLAAGPSHRPGGRPTFPEARTWHHTCANYYAGRWPAVRWARLAYGYAHMGLVKSACDFTEWFTESPARLLVTVAVALAVILGR